MNNIIAIDGPAGSGKSSTSKAVAKALGWKYLDTGAMYRAATVYCLAQEVPLSDEMSVYFAILQLFDETKTGAGLNISLDPKSPSIEIGGVDVTEVIREPHVSTLVRSVSGNIKARDLLVEMQKTLVEANAKSGIVVEGRDVTDVIAPDARLKLLITASEAIRAKRRGSETVAEIHSRDAADSKVNEFMHAKTEDTVVIDNTNLDLRGTVAKIVELWNSSESEVK